MPQINVTVDAPDGLPEPEVTISYRPGTPAEFEAIIEALGGLTALSGVTRSIAYLHLDGTSLSDSKQIVYVHAPAELDQPRPVLDPLSAFMSTVKERLTEAREAQRRVEQMT